MNRVSRTLATSMLLALLAACRTTGAHERNTVSEKTHHEPIGVLSIQANVEDARISVDGQPVEDGKAGPLDPGDHTVTVEADGYEPFTQTVTIGEDAHEIPVAVTLKELPGKIAIMVNTPCDCDVGGAHQPAAPDNPITFIVPPGIMEVTCRAPRFKDASAIVTVKGGRIVSESFSLKPSIYVEPMTGLEFVWLDAGTVRLGCASEDPLCLLPADSDASDKGKHKKAPKKVSKKKVQEEGTSRRVSADPPPPPAEAATETDKKPAVKGAEVPGDEVDVNAFWIGKTEVTEAAYRKCVAAKACETPRWEEGAVCTYTGHREKSPINCITWEQASELCNWIGGKLPTVAQWEYAARAGGDDIIYPWGNEPLDRTRANYCDVSCKRRLEEVKLKGKKAAPIKTPPHMADRPAGPPPPEQQNDRFATMAPVGSFPAGANAVGLLDMSGNVQEWLVTDGVASKKDRSKVPVQLKMVAGGSWFDAPLSMRVSATTALDLTAHSDTVGVRCVLP